MRPNIFRTERVHAVALGSSIATLVGAAHACPNCATSEEVYTQIGANSPMATLGVLSLAFGVVAALVVITARLAPVARLLLGASLLLGAGLGAFFDGILLHQILQWHAMISSQLPPVDIVSSKVNMFWDGIFHLYCWLSTLVALVLIFKELPRFVQALRNGVVAGGMVAGWGYFNVVEGVIDHQVFGLHHVHPGLNQSAWDAAFLVFGGLLIAAGATLAIPVLRRAPRAHPR
jgi:uncharacterized membrane protein